MGRIDQETVNKILDTADIVDVVSDFVKLRRAGANYKGLCPFHDERTPSFSVNKARNICKCFSCGKGGSPVGFIMEHEQLSYAEALRYLARKYNIEIIERELSDNERKAATDREALLALNEFALEHFEHNLTQTQEGRDIALAYFRHRGINDAMIKRFHLGYSLEQFNALAEAAVEHGFTQARLIETGLCLEGRNGGIYDRFKSRIIFPIHSVSGRVVGFGGRTMRSDKTVAKYVNSPESLIYVKNRELYGLYQAKSAIARKDKAILVEGYMDVISMHQAGVENVVASSGTSLTQGQIRAIGRFSRNITVIYDSDAAGIKASLRGIGLLLGEGLSVKVVLLPEGDDPDSFAQNHSTAEVEAYIKDHEQDIIAFMADILMRQVSENDPTARAKVINTILRTVATVDDAITRLGYVALCARTFNMAEDVISLQIKKMVEERLEQQHRDALREKAQQSIRPLLDEENKASQSDEPDQDLVASVAANTPAATGSVIARATENPLLPYEKMILRYAVRYGLLFFSNSIKADADENTPDEQAVESCNVSQFIAMELKAHGLSITDPALAAMLDKILETGASEAFAESHARAEAQSLEEYNRTLEKERDVIRRTASSVQEIEKLEQKLLRLEDAQYYARIDSHDLSYLQRQLTADPDDKIRRLATDMLAERHSLSSVRNSYGHVETEQEQLSQLLPRSIYELLGAVDAIKIKELHSKIKTVSPEEAQNILLEIIRLQQHQSELAKTNGERIILPRRK